MIYFTIMNKILCFGDSNTYGYNPLNGKRFNSDIRWSGILKNILKGKFEVIEDGCNNRTGVNDSINGNDYTGYKAIEKHFGEEFAVIILAFGINDIQKFYDKNIEKLETKIDLLIKKIRTKQPQAKILILSPPHIKREILNSNFKFLFNEDAIENSKMLSEIYKIITQKNDCYFLDINKISEVSRYDGLHFDEINHKKIAEEILKKISTLSNEKII